jgi:hypothetical protein
VEAFEQFVVVAVEPEGFERPPRTPGWWLEPLKPYAAAVFFRRPPGFFLRGIGIQARPRRRGLSALRG